ncbi:hypothetical protein B7R54_01040 [Subtercola boreus]|uniref:GGDEF domain-containing protein n=1 Tax=Subtercola boreus TaxID=120213 RepID=A0A3E0VE73_9MICO|nr:sensor domain-containing diguanylate cyclase [Subtercola boreus]RFA07955.1 hypothetical protein B7R54_01040 [Subtercola boreus]TQL55181.1 diguanylate cyclase (GGDEF)-like protein [Subtercola boreus]
MFVGLTARQMRSLSIQVVFFPGAAFLGVLAVEGDFNPGWARWVAFFGVAAGLAVTIVARFTPWVTNAFTTRLIAATMALTAMIGFTIQPPAVGVLTAFVYLGIAVGGAAFLRLRVAIAFIVVCTILGLSVVLIRSSVPLVASIVFLALTTITTIVVIVLRQSLQAARDEAIALSLTDSLTGLANRRSMDAQVPLMIAVAERTSQHLGCLLIDIDQFKTVNDEQGHSAGDRVLLSIADAIREATREADLGVRIGGDEFCVFTIVSRRGDLQIIAERLRTLVQNLPTTPVTTISVGGSSTVPAAASSEPPLTLDDLLHRADQALYEAKSAGRNQSRIYG